LIHDENTLLTQIWPRLYVKAVAVSAGNHRGECWSKLRRQWTLSSA
jgi:hypothetical protein